MPQCGTAVGTAEECYIYTRMLLLSFSFEAFCLLFVVIAVDPSPPFSDPSKSHSACASFYHKYTSELSDGLIPSI